MTQRQAEEIPVVAIVGPTGVGKTDLSIRLAQEFNGEVVNGDSMQIYRHLDIGTGKIPPEEMADVPHHLLNILDVTDSYDAANFQKNARSVIQDIASRGKLPILVGGTGLYVEGLLYDLEFGGQDSSDPQVRQELEEELDQIGDQALWKHLKDLDPQAAKKIPYQNTRRTIRALEVMKVTGERFSIQESQREQVSVFDELVLVLDRPRQALYERINQRVLQMADAGSEEEARRLYDTVKGEVFPSTRGIGYKEWWPYFQGTISREEAIQQIQQNSRRYAKRQLTWFRNRFKNRLWLDASDEEALWVESSQLVEAHLNKKGIEK